MLPPHVIFLYTVILKSHFTNLTLCLGNRSMLISNVSSNTCGVVKLLANVTLNFIYKEDNISTS